MSTPQIEVMQVIRVLVEEDKKQFNYFYTVNGEVIAKLEVK